MTGTEPLFFFFFRGLGYEICRGLAESGADVALMYVSSESTHETAAALAKEFGVKCQAYKADVADPKAVQEAIDQIYKDFGGIDVFVANAGISYNGNAEVCIPNFAARSVRTVYLSYT